MSITTPTLEQFMAEPQDDHEEVTWAAAFDTTPDPLGAIAESLGRIVTVLEHGSMAETETDRLREQYADLDAKHAELWDLVEELEAILKPSTSKLANALREAIGRWRGVEPAQPPLEPEPMDPVVEPQPIPMPEKDAPIEEWVAFAQAHGHDVDPGRTNRSQIRTLLGIPQVEADA